TRIVGVSQYRIKDRLRVAGLFQRFDAAKWMVAQRRKPFVVHVVQEPRDTPQLFVLSVMTSVSPHRSLDGERMFPQVFTLGPFAEHGPSFISTGIRQFRSSSQISRSISVDIEVDPSPDRRPAHIRTAGPP